jgi:hypothetical protein
LVDEYVWYPVSLEMLSKLGDISDEFDDEDINFLKSMIKKFLLKEKSI